MLNPQPSRPGVLVYLIGEPGSGKTTAMRHAWDGYSRTELKVEGCPVMELVRTGWRGTGLPARAHEIGRDRDQFGGTDALAMNIGVRAAAAMRALSGLVVAEGDRLAHDGFLTGCAEHGWQVRVVALTTPPAVAADRRAARGGGQNETWVKGRRTKVVSLAQRWGAIRIDGDCPPEVVGVQLRAQIAAYWDTRPK